MELYSDWPIGELDEYHSFREKKYKYIYLCLNCLRSFESATPTNNCKFCSGEIKRLAPIPATENYTVEHDMKKRMKRFLLRAIKKYLKPKGVINKGSQKTLHEKYPIMQKKIPIPKTQKRFYMPKMQMNGFPKIFSSRNKEELPAR